MRYSFFLTLIFAICFVISNAFTQNTDINIQDLQKRLLEKESQLSKKEKLLNEREKRLTLLESELKNKQKELEDVRNLLQKMYDDIKGAGDENLDKLVKTLSNTKPKSAAAIIENMDIEQSVKVLKKMDPKKSGAIMSALGKSNPSVAAKISERIIPQK